MDRLVYHFLHVGEGGVLGVLVPVHSKFFAALHTCLIWLKGVFCESVDNHAFSGFDATHHLLVNARGPAALLTVLLVTVVGLINVFDDLLGVNLSEAWLNVWHVHVVVSEVEHVHIVVSVRSNRLGEVGDASLLQLRIGAYRLLGVLSYPFTGVGYNGGLA